MVVNEATMDDYTNSDRDADILLQCQSELLIFVTFITLNNICNLE